MGLEEIFQNAAKTIISSFGNVPHTVTYTHYGQMVYDDVTKTKTIPETNYTFSMIFTKFTQSEILMADNMGDNILPTDTKGLVATKDLAIEPSPKDKVTDSNGDVFSIIGFRIDPANALKIIYLRKV